MDPMFSLTGILEAAIGDVRDGPPGCIELMIACAAQIEAEWDRELTSNAYSLFVKIMEFLAWSRGPQEMQQLELCLSVCRCQKTLQSLRDVNFFQAAHDPANWDSNGAAEGRKPPLTDLLNTMSRMLARAIQSAHGQGKIYKASRNRKRHIKSDSSPPWPASPDEILPFGPQATIHSLSALLYDFRGAHDMTHLLCVILSTCGPQVVPDLISNKVLFPSLCIDLALWVQRHNNTIQINPSDLAVVHHWAIYLNELTRWTGKQERADFVGTGLIPPASAIDCFCIVADMLSSFELIKATPQDLEVWCGVRDIFVDFAADVHCTISVDSLEDIPGSSLLENEISDARQAVVERAQEMQLEREDPYMAMFGAYVAFHQFQRCWAPGCLQSPSDHHRAFRRCSRCRTVAYCSPECQRSSYRHSLYPHSAVCHLIGEVAEVCGIPSRLSPEDASDVLSRAQALVPVEVCWPIVVYVDGIKDCYAESGMC